MDRVSFDEVSLTRLDDVIATSRKTVFCRTPRHGKRLTNQVSMYGKLLWSVNHLNHPVQNVRGPSMRARFRHDFHDSSRETGGPNAPIHVLDLLFRV